VNGGFQKFVVAPVAADADRGVDEYLSGRKEELGSEAPPDFTRNLSFKLAPRQHFDHFTAHDIRGKNNSGLRLQECLFGDGARE
jgi:hypothetical protein